MKYVCAVAVLCALMVVTVAAQQYPTSSDPQSQPQYPQTQNPQQYPPAQQPYPQQQYPNAQQYPSSQYPDQMGQYTIPAGTELSIRTNEAIVADKNSGTGRSYSAEVAKDIMGANGQVLVPRGSPAQLTVQGMSSGTLGVGNNDVALALQSLTINGRPYQVISNTQKSSGERGIGKNKRTGEMVGGGAVLGTVIGAIAGGAKGAVIGAIAGAGAGGAAQIATRGSQVKVPAESVLTFKLDQPLTLQQ